MPFSSVVKGVVSKFSKRRPLDHYLSHFTCSLATKTLKKYLYGNEFCSILKISSTWSWKCCFIVHDGVKNEKSTREFVIQGYYWGGGLFVESRKSLFPYCFPILSQCNPFLPTNNICDKPMDSSAQESSANMNPLLFLKGVPLPECKQIFCVVSALSLLASTKPPKSICQKSSCFQAIVRNINVLFAPLWGSNIYLQITILFWQKLKSLCVTSPFRKNFKITWQKFGDWRPYNLQLYVSANCTS